MSLLRLIACCLPVLLAAAEPPVVLPAGSVIDLSQAPYAAPSDGRADATEAIRKALADTAKGGGTLYLPAGTYLISDTLALQGDCKRTIWQGAGRGRTVIRLKDACAGFTDPAKPKAMFSFGGDPAQRFRNHMFDLTVDAGRGNPGAIGVQYYTSNQGAMMRIEIVAGEGSGRIGLDTSYKKEIGPGLIGHLRISGFDIGIQSKALNSITLEHVLLEGQRQVGIDNLNHVMTVRDLTVRGAPLAVRNGGTMTLVDAKLTGTGDAAVVNSGRLFVRDLAQQGWKTAIANQTKDAGASPAATGATVAEWTSVAPAGIGQGPHASLRLAVAEPPAVPWGDPAKWVDPFAFGAVGDGVADDTAAIQKAIDSGAETVYLPRRRDGNPCSFAISGELVLRGKLRRFFGSDGMTLAVVKGAEATLVAGEGDGPLAIERLDLLYRPIRIAIRSKRPVALAHLTLWKPGLVSEGTGDLFLTDVCTHGEFTQAGQRVFMRQINTENPDVNLVSRGAHLWILGIKTERAGIKIDAQGGKVEVLGGFAYCTTKTPKETFIRAVDAPTTLAGLAQIAFGNPSYQHFVSGSIGGKDFATGPCVFFDAAP